MNNAIVWTLTGVPPFAVNLVRDVRVCWALEEAGFAYEVKGVAVSDRHAADHMARSPFGLVPVVEAQGATMIESGAIIMAIAEKSPALLPDDDRGRQEALAWTFAALTTMDMPIQTLFALDHLHAGETWALLERPSAVVAVTGRLSQLADVLRNRDYLLGQFTVADIAMVTVLRFLGHTDLVQNEPVLAAYVERCEARPAFNRALAKRDAVHGGRVAA